ncbi:uncharacterized mitochondrial protein-like protein, partial [Tanacetum coccineum]
MKWDKNQTKRRTHIAARLLFTALFTRPTQKVKKIVLEAINMPNPLVRIETIRLLIALAAGKGWKIIKQERYAMKILKEAGMEDCNPALCPTESGLKLSKAEDEPEVKANKYQKMVGCLRYLLHTRPDLTYLVGVISRYIQSPRESRARAIKQILRYLKGSTSFGINYKRGNDMRLVGYSSHNVDINDGRSTTKHVFYLAEFMVVTATACQAIWLREVLADVTENEQ